MRKKLIEFFMRRSKREKTVIYGAFIAMGILAADRFVLGPVIHRLSLLDGQIATQEEAIRKSLHVLVQKDRIKAEGKEYMSYSIEAQNPEQEMVDLLKQLESIAGQSGVSLLYVKPAKEEGEGTVKKYFASLECEAEMEQVAAFFHAVESSNKLLKIEKYDIQPKGKESSLARCAVTASKTVLAK